MGRTLWGANEGPIIVGQSIYDESATPVTRLGHVIRIGDRMFRYCRAGSVALTPGTMLQSPPGATGEKNLTLAVHAAGQNTVSVVLASITADELKDGYFGVYDVDAGVGQTYRIKSNTASAASTNVVTITLYDELVTATTASGKGVITRCPYNKVVIAPATNTGTCIGVSLIAVTALYYFWAQTKGPAVVLADSAWTMGDELVRGDSTPGALTIQVDNDGTLEGEEVAVAMIDSADAKYGMCMLKLE